MQQSMAYSLIETPEALLAFHEANKNAAWIALDTEFIGERRFETLLCLIQIATPAGYYLIDPLKVTDLNLFYALLEDERLLKITHAGENDYRLLNQNTGIIPRNIFDTQLAAGFLGHGYPSSYGKLVERELGVLLDKGYAATDWESRPLKAKQLAYALSDVEHLHELWCVLTDKLVALGRLEWARSEMSKWESAQYYERDPHKEALMNTLMNGLKPHKQVFLLRLYEWRRTEAQRMNHSKEMVLASKYIAPILRGVDAGKQALLDSRIIPDRLVETHWPTLQRLYQKPISEEETAILKRLPVFTKEDPKKEISIELLYVLVKFKCLESGIAPSLVFNKSELSYALPGVDLFGPKETDWRRSFLGEAMVKWLNERKELHVEVGEETVVVETKI